MLGRGVYEVKKPRGEQNGFPAKQEEAGGLGFRGGPSGKSLPEPHAGRETLSPAAQGVGSGPVGQAPAQSRNVPSAAQEMALNRNAA